MSSNTLEFEQLDEGQLATIIKSLPEGEAVTTRLAVDERVIARVTDGIYRQPSSALRELISNAYDADATRVIVHTDAPRFDRIVIRDNGRGMSPEVVAYLVNHIGGSSKRTYKGKELGTVSDDSVLQSKSHRKLIGKIGIGLFAVSQLTQHFQIITKRKGDDFRTSAVVVLRTHSEEHLAEEDAAEKFEAGTVTITRVPTTDVDAQGTEIILMDLRKATKDGLGSVERWAALDSKELEPGESDLRLGNANPPAFHIGRVDPADRSMLVKQPNLPWDSTDDPATRFSKLYDAIAAEVGKSSANPTTEQALDSYLKMLWDISLAVPVDYLEKHPFKISSADGIELFEIDNDKRGQAKELKLQEGQSIADALAMESGAPDPAGGFQVIIDDVELHHPIKIDSTLRASNNSRGKQRQEKPILFAGKCITPFSSVPHTLGGGSLEFEAYFYWNPVIAPKENNGVLIRVNNASGTLFDETFLDYRVAELTRLKQIMAEVYVTKGLDPALNIDRESFNSSHPHYQFLKDWIHRAIRQATNRLKAVNKESLGREKAEQSSRQQDKLAQHVEKVWTKVRGEDVEPPEVKLTACADLATELERRAGTIVIEHSVQLPPNVPLGARDRQVAEREAKVKALAGVLAAYGITENMTYHQVQSLISDIDAIYNAEV